MFNLILTFDRRSKCCSKTIVSHIQFKVFNSYYDSSLRFRMSITSREDEITIVFYLARRSRVDIVSRQTFHSGQMTGHSREHARVYALPVTIPLRPTKFPRSTSAARAISVLSSIILPLQTFFSQVLLLRQQPFWSQNLPPERPTTTIAIKTLVVMFRYELVNSTRKFTIVAEIVSLLKKIYKRDVPFRAVFKVKTLAVSFSPYPREIKTYREI